MKTSLSIVLAFWVSSALSGVCQNTSTPYFASISTNAKSSGTSYHATRTLRENWQSAFSTLFPLAENVSWGTINNATKVVFSQNGLTTKAFFHPDGTLSYTLTNYPAERLPEEMLRNIFQTYKRHKILSAKELVSLTTKTFYVIVENKGSYKTLKITDNQIEQVKKLRKSTFDRDNG